MPMPIAKRFTPGLPNTAQPVITLPTIATTIKKAAITNPARFSGLVGLSTFRSALAPTVTKKMGTRISAIGITC